MLIRIEIHTLLLLLVFVQCLVSGNPARQRQRRIENTKWKVPTRSVNVTSFSRGSSPLLRPMNHNHKLPLKSVELSDVNWVAKTKILKKPIGLEKEIEHRLRTSISCSSCRAGIYFLLRYAQGFKPNDSVQPIVDICTNFFLLSTEVCVGLISRILPEVIFVFNRANFDVNEFCAALVLSDDCMGNEKSFNENWKVKLPSMPKPRNKNIRLPQENLPSFKVLHLTDTHHDPLYAEGSNAVCKEPLCCRDKSQIVLRKSDGAGKWGDYRYCDPPKATIDNMFDHIVEVHADIDYIIWTGDLQPHNIWSETKEENLKLLRDMVATMKKKFPNIPIFPAIGNHEGSPVNNFPHPFVTDPQFSNQWLLDEIDTLWRLWLPANASATIKYGGFYSVLVRPGFRIISINTNYCYAANFWLLINATDPGSQLQWLVYELRAAELSKEKVHIIGHIPPGYVDCMRIWSRNYHKIIGRFESTISGQFFGHTHGDEFQIFWDPDDLSRAISVAYIAPSVTPYFDFNPGYKIYYVDGDHADTTRMVIDKEAWIFNLSDANMKGTPPYWYKLYSARSSYGMNGLRPADWKKFVHHMEINDELFDLYHKHYWRDSPKRPKCDLLCKQNFICDARSGRSHDRKVLCGSTDSSNYYQQFVGLFSGVAQLIKSARRFFTG